MLRSRRIIRTASLIAVAAVLAGCAPSPALPTLTAEEIDASGVVVASTVGEARAAVPEGTLALIDARMAMGLGNQTEVLGGPPGASFDDWVVVGHCGYPGGSPAVEVAAIPPELDERRQEAAGWNLLCDGAPEGWSPFGG